MQLMLYECPAEREAPQSHGAPPGTCRMSSLGRIGADNDAMKSAAARFRVDFNET